MNKNIINLINTIDNAQTIEKDLIELIMSRIKPDTKVILVGEQQVTSEYLVAKRNEKEIR